MPWGGGRDARLAMVVRPEVARAVAAAASSPQSFERPYDSEGIGWLLSVSGKDGGCRGKRGGKRRCYCLRF